VDEIEVKVIIERRVDCGRRSDQEKSVAVGWRSYCHFGGDIRACLQLRRIIAQASCTAARKFVASLS